MSRKIEKRLPTCIIKWKAPIDVNMMTKVNLKLHGKVLQVTCIN